jgi:hypothetical protein
MLETDRLGFWWFWIAACAATTGRSCSGDADTEAHLVQLLLASISLISVSLGTLGLCQMFQRQPAGTQSHGTLGGQAFAEHHHVVAFGVEVAQHRGFLVFVLEVKAPS